MSIHEQDPPAPGRVEIEGDGIVLRQFVLEDADTYFDLLQRNKDFLSQKHQGGTDETGGKYESALQVADSILYPVPADKLRLGIWDADKMVGTINLTPEDADSAEIGYLLDEGSTGHGYMTRALKSLCDYAFEDMGMKSLFAHVYVGNEDSKGVLERNGFRHTQTLDRVRDEKPETLWVFEKSS